MLERHRNAIDQNDRLNFLQDHQEAMTEGENERFWEQLRRLFDAEMELDNLYKVIKDRVDTDG